MRAAGAGSPLIWFRTDKYAGKTELSWRENYTAYTSLDEIVSGGQIIATNSYLIEPGQTLKVLKSTGTGTVEVTGTPKVISIKNETETEFACGISQANPGGSVTPMCAFPLYGGNLNLIAPIAKILLMFSTNQVNTGTVIHKAYSSGLLIDLTNENSRQVSYHINTGWGWDGGSWAAKVKADASLTPLLIEKSKSLAERHLASLHQR